MVFSSIRLDVVMALSECSPPFAFVGFQVFGFLRFMNGARLPQMKRKWDLNVPISLMSSLSTLSRFIHTHMGKKDQAWCWRTIKAQPISECRKCIYDRRVFRLASTVKIDSRRFVVRVLERPAHLTLRCGQPPQGRAHGAL